MKPISRQLVLFLGDVVTLAIVTLIGLARHGTLESAPGSCFLATFLPWVLAWLLAGFPLGVFASRTTAQLRHLWRPFWAMVLASPLGALLRAVWLNGVVQPVFVAVFGGIAALGILAWRAVYWLLVGRKQVSGG
jgi:hypothetical protein